ncbi:hypothetical protein ABN034_18595 [Actinopolymorpha sp. B11F2]|uniref:hypothetical protein n=1 Tax=Actinopolymorpha sp. B11F2 TaxID=3160862 RepID=UPI0032E4F737
MGAQTSHNAKQLRAVARRLGEAELETRVVRRIRDLEIPALTWPLLAALGSASEYGRTRQAADEAAVVVDTVVGALGRTVEAVAAYYERMEEQYGTDFDSAIPETERSTDREK